MIVMLIIGLWIKWRPTCLGGGSADGARWCGREPLVRWLLFGRQNCSHQSFLFLQSKHEQGARRCAPARTGTIDTEAVFKYLVPTF